MGIKITCDACGQEFEPSRPQPYSSPKDYDQSAPRDMMSPVVVEIVTLFAHVTEDGLRLVTSAPRASSPHYVMHDACAGLAIKRMADAVQPAQRSGAGEDVGRWDTPG